MHAQFVRIQREWNKEADSSVNRGYQEHKSLLETPLLCKLFHFIFMVYLLVASFTTVQF